MEETEKVKLRRHYRQRRRQSLPAAAASIAATARRQIPDQVPPGRRIGLYWPLAQEPDLRILTQLPPLRVALPAVRPEAGLVYLAWEPGQPLEKDCCGVPAPVASEPLVPEALALLLAPALAISPEGVRLGSGGGWYDRLRADPRWRAIPALAVLPAECVAPTLPRDPWDVPFSGWLDEEGIHWIASGASDVATSRRQPGA